jgi:sugar lactone lactonase YvrE
LDEYIFSETDMKLKNVIGLIFLCLTTWMFSCSSDEDSPVSVVPAISNISPVTGVPGTGVIITGSNFSNNPLENLVKFNGVAAIVTNATSTQITTSVPIAAATGPVTVEVAGKLATSTTFTVNNPAPLITSINPASGNKATSVVITGENFGTDVGKVKVFFNDKEATISSLTNTTITSLVPINAGNGIVKVTIGGIATIGPAFTYIPSITVSTIAGDGIFGFKDGTGTAAQFQLLLHKCTDSHGNIYVVDQVNHRIRKITPAGVVTTFAGDGTGLGDIGQPNGICADKNDNIYVSDVCKIKKITPAGVVSLYAGQPLNCGAVDGGPSVASFSYPYGMCVDNSGNIYVADRSTHSIRKITPAGVTSTLAGGTYGDENGAGTAAKFRYPHDVCADADDNIYVVDQSNNKIKKITPGGLVSTFIGSTPGHSDGMGTAARINTVNDLCFDPVTGNFYFGENTMDSVYIRMITPQGKVNTLMGNVIGHANGSATEAKFYSIHGISIDSQGTLYVTEQSARVRKIVIE